MIVFPQAPPEFLSAQDDRIDLPSDLLRDSFKLFAELPEPDGADYQEVNVAVRPLFPPRDGTKDERHVNGLTVQRFPQQIREPGSLQDNISNVGIKGMLLRGLIVGAISVPCFANQSERSQSP